MCWWGFLLVLLTVTLYFRYSDVISGKAVPFDAFIVLIWIALALVPVFSEVEFWGFKFKQQLPPAPPDSKLPELKQKADQVLSRELERALAVPKPDEIKVDPDTEFLFATRHNIEKELNRLWSRHIVPADFKVLGIIQATDGLINNGIIDSSLVNVIKDVYSICSLAVHGKPVSREKVDFVKHVGPKLIASLKAIE